MWFGAKCPVIPREQAWIEDSLRWLVDEFGSDVLHGAVILPTSEFFPGTYTGSHDDVRTVLERICGFMGVDSGRVELEFLTGDKDAELLAALPSYERSWSGAAGHYLRRDGRNVVAVQEAQADNPMALVATIAHELGHVRLLGEDRISPTREDHEPLADLTTVLFGLGIFTANSAFDFSQHGGGWRSQRLGYLTEPMFGYALAYYAWLRGETKPEWARHVDPNPRAFLKKGLRYLRR